VQAAEHIGMLHADARRAVSAHRMAYQSTTLPIWECPVMGIDVCDHVVRNELLEVSGCHRA